MYEVNQALMDEKDKFMKESIKQYKADTWFVRVFTFKYPTKMLKSNFRFISLHDFAITYTKFSSQKNIYLKVSARNNTGILSQIP